MKFTVSQPALDKALTALARISNEKSTVPILTNIWIRAHEGTLQMAATDLCLYLSIAVPAEIEEEGSTSAPVKTMSEWVRAATAEMISLSVKDKRLKLKANRSTATFPTLDADEFPVIDLAKSDVAARIKASDLIAAIRRTSYALTNNTIVVGGNLCIDIQPDKIVLVGGDGLRLNKVTIPGEIVRSNQFSISVRAVDEMEKVLRRFPNETAILSRSGNMLVIEIDNIRFVALLNEFAYPTYDELYRRQVPKAHAVVSTKDFAQAIDRLLTVADDESQFVFLDNKKDAIRMRTIRGNGSLTAGSEVVDAETQGKFLIALNAKHLKDSFDNTDAAQVELVISAIGDRLMFCYHEEQNGLLHHALFAPKVEDANYADETFDLATSPIF